MRLTKYFLNLKANVFYKVFFVSHFQECFNLTMQLHLVHLAPNRIPTYESKNTTSLADLFVGFLKYFATEFE